MLSLSSPRRLSGTLPVLLLACMVSGCSSGSSYPSLASRPAERLADAPAAPPDQAPVAAKTQGAPSAEMTARLQQLVADARNAQRDFADKRAGAEQDVGAGGAAPVGSEAWARAAQALSSLESARSLTAQPLAEFDRLEIDDRIAHPGAADGDLAKRQDASAIAKARATVDEMVAGEDLILANLDRHPAS